MIDADPVYPPSHTPIHPGNYAVDYTRRKFVKLQEGSRVDYDKNKTIWLVTQHGSFLYLTNAESWIDDTNPTRYTLVPLGLDTMLVYSPPKYKAISIIKYLFDIIKLQIQNEAELSLK